MNNNKKAKKIIYEIDKILRKYVGKKHALYTYNGDSQRYWKLRKKITKQFKDWK